MIIDNPTLFEQAANELGQHLGHKLTVTTYGADADPASLAVECEDCHACLIDFLRESGNSQQPTEGEIRGPL